MTTKKKSKKKKQPTTAAAIKRRHSIVFPTSSSDFYLLVHNFLSFEIMLTDVVQWNIVEDICLVVVVYPLMVKNDEPRRGKKNGNSKIDEKKKLT